MYICDILPCYKDNEDNKYYKGTKNFLDNRCRKCEFINSLAYFMRKNYENYALEKCCDVESSKDNQPEAILVNKNTYSSKIAIEVKSLHHLFDDNIKKDDKEKRKIEHFKSRILDEIGKRVYREVDEFLIENNIELTTELSDLFLYGILLSVYKDTEYEEKNGLKYIPTKSVPEEFLSFKGGKEQELINTISHHVAAYIILNIYVCLKGEIKKYRNRYDFQIGNLKFAVGKSKIDNCFRIQYFEKSGIGNNFYPPREAVRNRINKYFIECKDKFSEYMSSEYKRVLLITNENNYFDDKVIEQIKEFELPEYIDEVWCSFYVYEEIWNEKLEEFDGERIIDINYIKVLHRD